MFGLNKKELVMLKKLNTPEKIQDFINKIPINFDYIKDTCMSPGLVLRKNKCHCIEGAILAALCLKLNGKPPLILDLEANEKDYDHVIAVFKEDGKWGAISKTNHAVLRYRDPVYNSIRELVMSYFHEYNDKKGRKNLRRYSLPVDLSMFDGKNWVSNEKNIWFIPEYLVKVKHYDLIGKKQVLNLRNSDKIEIVKDKLVEWRIDNKKPNKFKIGVY